MTAPQGGPQVVTPIGVRSPSQTWTPIQGTETSRLLAGMKRINETEKETLVSEAGEVLGSARAPDDFGASRTGLVIGFVQSGKTASFTTVAALARDNGFRLVIVITGISTNLLDQSNDRLLTDLAIDTREDRSWRVIQNPTLDGASAPSTLVSLEELQGALDLWSRPGAPIKHRQTVLVTVMKHHRHLRNLTKVVQHLRLANVPTLVIDDEADQAGLNNRVAQNDQSPTYRRILALRGALGTHTYLQYTATPQAPLLVSLADSLSPDFVRVLTPGDDYVGGEVFFESRPELVRVIPQTDIVTSGNSLSAPPESLLEALRLFFLGIAVGLLRDEGIGSRSMLIHPSQGTLQHALYYQWVLNIRQTWLSLFDAPAGDSSRNELLQQFRDAYADLSATMGGAVETFDKVAEQLSNALLVTKEIEVNAVGGRTPRIDWQASYGHILIGGQAMDRGFTVEGLTVTYMPRGGGTGMADTIQQRARFLGYKKSYIGLCRVFLEFDVRNAFQSLVVHERAMRTELERHAATGAPLSEWRRRFFLDPQLKPTRDSVIGLATLTRHNYETESFRPRVVFDEPGLAETNGQLVQDFEATLRFELVAGGDETNLRAVGVSLSFVLRELLSLYRLGDPADSIRLTALLIQLQRILERDPEATCTVYSMGRGRDPHFLRQRPVAEETGLISAQSSLFQGRNSANGYVGDENLPTVLPDRVQVQLHHLELHAETLAGHVLASDACVVICKITAAGSQDLLLQ